MSVQGSCAVLVHSLQASKPDGTAVRALAAELESRGNVQELLVFVNQAGWPGSYMGCFVGVFSSSSVRCFPQNLGDLTYSLLTATQVYLEFRDKISWRSVHYIR